MQGEHIVYTRHVHSVREIQKSIILVEGYRAARVIHVTMRRITSCAEIDSKVAGKNSCNAPGEKRVQICKIEIGRSDANVVQWLFLLELIMQNVFENPLLPRIINEKTETSDKFNLWQNNLKFKQYADYRRKRVSTWYSNYYTLFLITSRFVISHKRKRQRLFINTYRDVLSLYLNINLNSALRFFSESMIFEVAS